MESKERKNLEFHARSLESSFPDGECSISGNKLVWIGELKPKPLSRTYEIKIEYEAFKEPEVRILSLKMIFSSP